jgi:hypothetical protein
MSKYYDSPLIQEEETKTRSVEDKLREDRRQFQEEVVLPKIERDIIRKTLGEPKPIGHMVQDKIQTIRDVEKNLNDRITLLARTQYRFMNSLRGNLSELASGHIKRDYFIAEMLKVIDACWLSLQDIQKENR